MRGGEGAHYFCATFLYSSMPRRSAASLSFESAFSVLIAFIVFGIFVFRIRERFDTVDVHALDRFRGE